MRHANTLIGCAVAFSEKHSEDYARKMASEGHAPAVGITIAERESLMKSGWIKSIAPPMTPAEYEQLQRRNVEVTRETMKTHLAKNIAATEEILSHGDNPKYGTAYRVILAHDADESTVYKMVYNRRKASLPERRRHVISAEQAAEIAGRASA